MNNDARILADQLTVTPVTAVESLRLLHKLLPLGHRLFPLVRQYATGNGLVSVPYAGYTLLYPSGWLNMFNTDVIFDGEGNKPEFTLLQSLLSQASDGAIVDVGANIGEYVLLLRQHSALPIISYEPSPVSFALLQRNVSINKLQDVDLRNSACGNSCGSIQLDVGIVSYIRHQQSHDSKPTGDFTKDCESFVQFVQDSASDFRTVPVPLVRLDEDLKDSKVSVLKIDVEGFEYEVLLGAENLLRTQRPLLFVELHPLQIEPQGHSLKDVCDLLRPLYKFEFWDPNYLVKPGRLAQTMKRFLGKGPYRFADEGEMLQAAYRTHRPAHPYMIGYPR